MATVRSSRVSRARYTSPMPPAPIAAWISYGPSIVPEDKGMGGNYSPERKGEALQTDILQRCTLSHKWYMGFVRFHSFGFSATRVFA